MIINKKLRHTQNIYEQNSNSKFKIEQKAMYLPPNDLNMGLWSK